MNNSDIIQKYQEGAARTCPDIHNPLMNNLHMLSGMCTEVGELMDVYKRELAYGKVPDEVNVKEEIGDMMWYIVNFCRINNISLEECLEINLSKLQIRYPEKFSSEAALNRNLEQERKVLEGNS